MEIQREIEELVARKDDHAIESKIKQFDLCTQEDVQFRKRAGLYGISVVTVALYQKVTYKILTRRNQMTICGSCLTLF